MNDCIRAYLISYDIGDDRRRVRVSDLLLSYGYRVQSSVFIIKANGAVFIRVKDGVKDMLNREEDSLIVCDLGETGSWEKRYHQYGHISDLAIHEMTVF